MQAFTNIASTIDNLNGMTMRIQQILSTHIGEYKMSTRSSDLNGWLICDGRTLNRIEYPVLFDTIGTTFGSTSSDNFNLPDFRGRVMGLVGQGNGLSIRSIGQMIGEEQHTLLDNETPVHTHSGTTSFAGLHNHTGSTATNGTHTHATNAAGGTIGLAVADGTNTVINTDLSGGGELNVWKAPQTLSVTAAGSHAHAVSNDGSHNHTFSTSSFGSGDAHNIMQPTLFAGNVMILARLDYTPNRG